MSITTQASQKFDFTIFDPTLLRNDSGMRHEAALPFVLNIPPQNVKAGPLADKGTIVLTIDEKELESLETFAEVFNYKIPKEDPLPFLTSGATATEDEIANISYFIRTLMPESVSTEAIGITTGENVFQGLWAAVKSCKRFKKAHQIHDGGGMFEGAVDAVRGTSQAIGGATYIGYRGLMIAANIKQVDTSLQATTFLGQAACGLSIVGNALFGIFYLMISVWATHGFVKDWQFSAAMKAYEGNESVLFDFLMRKVNADPKAKLQKLNAYWATLGTPVKETKINSWKKQLADSALSQFAKQYLKWQKELVTEGKLTAKPLTKNEVKAAFKLLFELQENALCAKGTRQAYLAKLGIDEADVAFCLLNTLELIGFALEEQNRKIKHEAKFSRAVNQECTTAIDKAAARGLNVRLKCDTDPLIKQSAEKELIELKRKVTLENKRNKWMHGALIAVGVLGLTATILGFLTLPPAGAIALIIITLLLVGTMGITDGCGMFDGWKSDGRPGRHDKTYILVISLVILAALGVSIGITLGFGLPLVPMILAAVIAGTSLSLAGTAYYKLSKKEKQWIKDHPDLSAFKAYLDPLLGSQDTECDEKTTALFKKLSMTDRHAVRNQYIQASKNGTLRFHQQKFKLMDQTANFGENYLLNAIDGGKEVNEEELVLLIRAIKKTTKFFWEKAAITKSRADQERALRVQSLFERISQRNNGDLLLKLREVQGDNEAYEKLKNAVWFVVKRNESLQDLRQAVEKVIADKRPTVDFKLALKGESQNKIFPLIDRVNNYKPAEGVA